jgi:hypothetical protein
MQESAVADLTLKKAQAKLAEAATLEKLTKAGKIEGKVVNLIEHPDMEGVATVELETPEPEPTMGADGKPVKPGAKKASGATHGAKTDRDSTSFQRAH